MATDKHHLHETSCHEEEVNWLECISAIETDRGLLYFCDQNYGKLNKNLEVVSEFKADFPEGSHLYSITAYNPFNKVSDRLRNELSNHQLLEDIRTLFPGCKTYHNFSFFPGRPHHFERGYTIYVPPHYIPGDHHKIVYNLAVKYQQAAFFKGVVLSHGITIPYVVLVQGEYQEIKEQLVAIRHPPIHPAFLHKNNFALFSDINDVLDMLYKTRESVDLCNDLYQIYLDNFKPNALLSCDGNPVISFEGLLSQDAAKHVSKLLGAEFCGNTPDCLKEIRGKVTHSTVLLAAFKTIADYIQASKINEARTKRPVVVHKYWSNTVASLIADEINKGQSNLPPKQHEIYQWPSKLLKPDAVILLQGKSKRVEKTERQKIKSSALRRMVDRSWISVPVTASEVRSVDHISSKIVDKLAQLGLIEMRMADPLCPATEIAPEQHLVNPVEGITDKITANKTAEAPAVGKPFWW